MAQKISTNFYYPISKTPLTTPIVFLLGGPGSGKDTLCAKIVLEFRKKGIQVCIIHPGYLLAEEMKKGSALGEFFRRAQNPAHHQMNEDYFKGLLNLVHYTLQKEDRTAKLFILNGYPRFKSQLEGYDNIAKPQQVIYLQATKELLETRCAHRLQTGNRPADDAPQNVEKRLQEFLNKNSGVAPIVEKYDGERKLIRINAGMRQDQIFDIIRPILERLVGQPPKSADQRQPRAGALRGFPADKNVGPRVPPRH